MTFLPRNKITLLVKYLAVIKHLASAPFDHKAKSYYTAVLKRTDPYIELISAKMISFMVKSEKKIESCDL